MEDVVANMTPEEFLASTALAPFYLPSPESALITKNKSWYYGLAEGTINGVKKSQIPQEINFAVKINKRPEPFYGEIIRIMTEKYNTDVERFEQYYGFDCENLPDPNYLLMCIYILDKDSVFIKALPRKINEQSEVQVALDRELEKKLLVAVLEGRKLVKATGWDFSGIKEEMHRTLQIFITYKTCKIDRHRIVRTAERIVQQSAIDPTIRLLAERYRLGDVLAIGGPIAPETREALRLLAANAVVQQPGVDAFPPT